MAEKKISPKKKRKKASGGAKKRAKQGRVKKRQDRRDLVLVTGAAGFLGQHVVREAVAQGFSVRATDLPGQDLQWAEDIGAEVISGDLTVREQAGSMVKGVSFVAHIAAAYNLALAREELLRVNRDGTRTLAVEAARAGVRHFINCSTADTYGTHSEVPVKETFQQTPENDYAQSKLEGERVVNEVGAREGMQVTTLRPTVIYGPGSLYTASLFCTIPFIVQRRLGFFPRFKGGPLMNAVHVQDMAGVTVFALPRLEMAGQAYNVADDQWQTVGDFFHNIVEPLSLDRGAFSLPLHPALLMHSSKLLLRVPEIGLASVNRLLQAEWSRIVEAQGLLPALNPRLDRGFFSYGLGDHVYDNSKLKAAGYKFQWPAFSAGWRETVRWYQEQKWIPHPPAGPDS